MGTTLNQCKHLIKLFLLTDYIDRLEKFPVHNYVLDDIVTPIKLQHYSRLLYQSEFPADKAVELIEGFRHGFEIGYRGPEQRTDSSANIPISVGSHEDMWDKITKEVKLGRSAGPFTKPPFSNFMQSPVGLVPKAGGQTRMIFHLSFDF